jgi:hypothetical protein
MGAVCQGLHRHLKEGPGTVTEVPGTGVYCFTAHGGGFLTFKLPMVEPFVRVQPPDR